MKLLGWMHRKFRQNNNETTKDYSIGITGQPSVEELQYYPRASNCSGTRPFSKAQRDNQCRNSFNSLDIARMEDYQEEQESQALTELFHGFLAIGTLGTTTEPIPTTPTFSISADHIAEKETQVTEEELRLINDELEKVLGDDESFYNVSSGRNSYVSGGRISHCSSVTTKLADGNGNGAITCPLQSYLLGSTSTAVKKEHRTSLGELFEKAEENSWSKSELRDEKKETDKSALHLMKKMLKMKLLHAATEKKLHKIRHIFNRKVHPIHSHKQMKNEIKNDDDIHWMASSSEGVRASTEDIIIYPQETVRKERSNSNQFEYNIDENSGSEVWVKTDADYLVLEL